MSLLTVSIGFDVAPCSGRVPLLFEWGSVDLFFSTGTSLQLYYNYTQSHALDVQFHLVSRIKWHAYPRAHHVCSHVWIVHCTRNLLVRFANTSKHFWSASRHYVSTHKCSLFRYAVKFRSVAIALCRPAKAAAVCCSLGDSLWLAREQTVSKNCFLLKLKGGLHTNKPLWDISEIKLGVFISCT